MIILDDVERPAPTDVNVVEMSVQRTDWNVNYSVSWIHDAENEPNVFYVVSAASSEGIMAEVTTNMKNAVLTLNYSTNYKIHVIASYKLPLEQIVNLPSETKDIRTYTGQPDPVRELNVKQIGCSHSLAISWKRPTITRGQLKEFKVEAFDHGNDDDRPVRVVSV